VPELEPRTQRDYRGILVKLREQEANAEEAARADNYARYF
jgi:hypothetical protein